MATNTELAGRWAPGQSAVRPPPPGEAALIPTEASATPIGESSTAETKARLPGARGIVTAMLMASPFWGLVAIVIYLLA